MTPGVDSGVWEQVERILAAGFSLSMVTTGGGVEMLSWLLNHPGASSAVVEAQVPYHAAAIAEYLGAPGPHRVAPRTAVNLAGRAWSRLGALAGVAEPRLGLGCTAALATRRTRRGTDRAFLAVRSEQAYTVWSVAFARGAAGRREEEEALSRLGVHALAAACGVEPSTPEWPTFATIERRALSLADPLGLLFAGEVDAVEVGSDGRVSAEPARYARLLLSGSFAPVHHGHLALAQAAQQACGRLPSLEISVENVDKPELRRDDLEGRLGTIGGRLPVLVTRAPTFVQKSRLFGACTFVVGYDTAVRLFEARYYADGTEGMHRAFAEMRRSGVCFLVAGRLQDTAFRTLDDVAVPAPYRTMFAPIPESAFRADVSSTCVRQQRQEAPRR